MRVAILTFGLTVPTLSVLGYALPRIVDEGSIEMASRSMLDPGLELVRREIGPGSPGYGIGVSAGSVDPIPVGSGGPNPVAPVVPVNLAPVNPLPVTRESVTRESETPESVTTESVTPESVTPESATPESVTPESVTPQPVTPATPRVNKIRPIPFDPNTPAIQQIRTLDCEQWYFGEVRFNAKPPYCSNNSPGLLPGF
ncbi:Activating transcription factor 7-interacting protein 1 [Lobaria immixta]|nr:Activating transcription factor 7-interacting protein 1 [Lobaria immixta]